MAVIVLMMTITGTNERHSCIFYSLHNVPIAVTSMHAYMAMVHCLNESHANMSVWPLWCFRTLLGISYRNHITNEEVKARIGNAIGPYEDLLTTVKRRKLKWYGHVTRSSGLAKTILQGTVQGGRRRGRQWKRWEDNIKEWTGLEWDIMLRKAENR